MALFTTLSSSTLTHRGRSPDDVDTTRHAGRAEQTLSSISVALLAHIYESSVRPRAPAHDCFFRIPATVGDPSFAESLDILHWGGDITYHRWQLQREIGAIYTINLHQHNLRPLKYGERVSG